MNTSAEQIIKSRAVELHGTTVVVNLVGGSTLTGTLAYQTISGAHGSVRYPDVLTITATSKAHTVPTAYVVTIGQG
ncbi:hypothetical protein ACFQ6Q_11315 [Streptomyces sp. NPDC056437]|uniref:hypothetical protein n=1 Tax=Streptomyces sp. NPDC056437 TaxID=3345816 RepID=UPI003682D74A